MTIAHFTPLNDIVSLRDAMDRLFEDSFVRPNGWSGLAAGHLAVPVDLWETKDAYQLRADIPGVTPDELEINATSDSISIAGEVKGRTDMSEDGWLDPTKVEATFENGVLQLMLPKAKNTKPRTIKINATNAKCEAVAIRTDSAWPGGMSSPATPF